MSETKVEQMYGSKKQTMSMDVGQKNAWGRLSAVLRPTPGQNLQRMSKRFSAN